MASRPLLLDQKNVDDSGVANLAEGRQPTFTIGSLINSGAIIAHKDGNYGSFYPRVEEFGPKGIPFLTAKCLNNGRIDIAGAPRLTEERASRLPFGFIEPGDVLLSHNATIGRVAVVPAFSGKMLVGTSLTYFRLDNARILPGYLAAFFSSKPFQDQLAAVMSHSTRNQVPITAQRSLRVVVPSLPEQAAIADLLNSLDGRINLLSEVNDTLEAMAGTIFQSWFVDFDPVRAKAEGREPEGMDAATAALFPSYFQDSGLGPLPRGWTSVPVYEIASYVNGAAYKAAHFSGSQGGLPIVKIAELKAGVTSNTKFTSANLGEKYRIEQDEILFSWSGNPDTSIDTFIWDGGTAWLNQHIFKVRENGSASRAQIYFQLRALRPRFAEIARDKQTTGLGHVTIADLKRIMVCLPNPGVRAIFDGIAGPLLEKIAANQACCKRLVELRDTLLPRLISCKLRLPDAEVMLAEAL